MSFWLILFGIVAIATLYVLLPVGFATFARYRRPLLLRCPLAEGSATIQVAAAEAAVAEAIGRPTLRATSCSRWPLAWGCRQQCLAAGAPAAAPAPGARTILVPLDGTTASEAVLPFAETIARREGARIRLLRMVPVPLAVRIDDRTVAYADQEYERVTAEARSYLNHVAERSFRARAETAVRVGDDFVAEIVAEAEASGAGFIVMLDSVASGPSCLGWNPSAGAVGRATRIPVIVPPRLRA